MSRYRFLPALLVLLSYFTGANAQVVAEESPNILVIVVDDLGYADMNFLPQAPADVATPGIDKLAKQGTYFSNAYATSPICSPSRCGLITGKYQQRWGNYWYGQGGLPNEILTIPQALQKHGYRTFKIGKTHVNGGPAKHPLDHGFDEFLGFNHHTWDYLRLSEKDLESYRNRSKDNRLGILNVGPLERNRGERESYEDSFTTDIFTEEAIRVIKDSASDSRPFYLHLSYNAVHHPTYVAHPRYASLVGFEQPAWDRNAKQWNFPYWDPRKMSWGQWHKNWGHLEQVDPLGRKRYLSQLLALDHSVSKIAAVLEETGLDKNTIVVFLSDNGGTINTYSNNAPLRGYKYMFGEGGVRIPLIVSWPGTLPERQTCASLASAMDVFPTLLELASGNVPTDLDGRSLVSNLREPIEASGHAHLCFADGKGTWSVRSKNWKLINSKGWQHKSYKLDEQGLASRGASYVYPEGLLLFDLNNDIGETKDVSQKHPDVVGQLTSLYKEWRSEMGQPRRASRASK